MKIKHFCIICIFFVLHYICLSQTYIAGFRASRILNSYPNKQFPNVDYWIETGKNIATKFNNTIPAAVWIVSLYWGDGVTGLEFPSPGGSYPYIEFLTTDLSELYLNHFDSEGFKIWLQVEPGAANVDTLINLVLGRYSHHPCVAGFGIDVEWYNANTNQWGRKITDEEAERWEKKVQSYNSQYTLFLKHFATSWMPPNYRGNILFVDDSQQFSSLGELLNDFKAWGLKFNPGKVAFQFGYPADKGIWSLLNDPMKEIGNQLLANIPNIYGLFWVDFTITQLYPLTIRNSFLSDGKSKSTILEQNYPNPFNPNTTIQLTIPQSEYISLIIYNSMGSEVESIFKGFLKNGTYKFIWSGENFANGIYYYRLIRGDKVYTKNMLLLK